MSNRDWENENAQQQAEHQSILAEERRKLNRQRETVEVMQDQMTEFIAAALKEDKNKQNLGQEGIQTMKDSQRGIDPVKDFLSKGDSQRFSTEGEVITGHEDRPWEKR